MKDYDITIGLEVHTQLLTNSKLFCSCSTSFGALPNEHTCPICLGLPGTLPVMNKKAIEYTIKAGLALNCKIAEVTKMDRKNYFYPDLPKAYQISQYDMPITYDGYLEVDVDGEVKRVGIKRAHLEEDAGKLVHKADSLGKEYSLVDYNRGGVPLMEIVTEPDIVSPVQARKFLENLKSILQYIEVSDCNMEEGSLRCDANISIRPRGESKLGTKTEIKNMNSFKAVEKALEYEVKRQMDVLDKGEKVVLETRRWDQDREVTYSMRSKEEAHDYRYFPDPDLLPVNIRQEWIEKIRSEIPELPESRKERFIDQYEIPRYDAGVLTSSRKLSEFYENTVNIFNNPKMVSNWIMGEVLRLLNIDGVDIDQCKITSRSLADILELVKEEKISANSGKVVLEEVYKTGMSPDDIVEEKNLIQIGDTSEIENIVSQVIEENPGPVNDYLSGKKKAIGFLVGQVMKKTKGKANPKMANKIIQDQIQEGK